MSTRGMLEERDDVPHYDNCTDCGGVFEETDLAGGLCVVCEHEDDVNYDLDAEGEALLAEWQASEALCGR